MRNTHHVGQLVIVFLGHFAFVNNNRIVKVAALDKTGLQQRLNFAYKHESTACGDFILELRHVLQRCKLVGEDVGIV